MKLTQKEQIPAFVRAVVDTGCDPCAIGHFGYTIGDVDLPPHDREAVASRLKGIDQTFGDRDHLRLEIVAHLRFLGHYIDTTEH